MSFYKVSDYGAVGDGKTNDAPAIQKAMDECSQKGGGRVVLESGHTYYSSSLFLKEGVDLHLEKGSKLLASSNLEDYFRPNQQFDEGNHMVGTPVTGKPAYAFIYAKDADEISITGEGKIDGNVWSFVHYLDKYYANGDFYPRPTMVYVEHCNHISFRQVTLQNAPFWTLHPAGCDDVLIDSIRIRNPLDVANSDGIDPDHCSNVRITGCHVVCADDCICLKTTAGNKEYGPTKNVVIDNCTLTSTSAAMKIGTEGVGNFENIVVSNCCISDSNRGISIQIRDEGNVKNVFFSNIMITTRRFADWFWGCAEPIAVTTLSRDGKKPSGTIKNVQFRNICCEAENGAIIYGEKEGMIQDVLMENVSVTLRKASKWSKGVYDLRPDPDENRMFLREPSYGVWMQRVKGGKISDCRFAVEEGTEEYFQGGIRCDECEMI